MINLKSIAEKLIKIAQGKNIYIVLRFQQYRSRSLAVKNSKVDSSELIQKEGTGIHAFTKKGNMGFSSVDTIINTNRLTKCLDTAISLAKVSEENNFETINEIFSLKPEIGKKVQRVPIDPFKITNSTFEKDLLKINKRIKDKYNDFSVTNRSVFYQDKINIFRSDRTDTEFTASNGNLYSFLTINKDENTNQMFNSTHSYGYELIQNPKKLNYHYKLLDNNMQYVKKLYKADKLKPGNYPILLDNDIAGVFIHEAFGHTAESDLHYSKSPLLRYGKVRRGEKIAPDYVNIYDEATAKDRGFYAYDSWGVKRQRVNIIKKGRINELINDVVTYKKTNTKLKGGAKAEYYSDIPIPRMSCMKLTIDKPRILELNFDPMVNKVEKIHKVLIKNNLFKKYKTIVYLVGSFGGMVDSFRGNFQFASMLSFKLTKDDIQLLKQASFSGITLEVLKSIKYALGKPKVKPGFCFKYDQVIIESAKSPLLLIDKNKYITVG